MPLALDHARLAYDMTLAVTEAFAKFQARPLWLMSVTPGSGDLRCVPDQDYPDCTTPERHVLMVKYAEWNGRGSWWARC